MTPFSWLIENVLQFTAPERFQSPDDFEERHGSWQWSAIARRHPHDEERQEPVARYVIFSVTPVMNAVAFYDISIGIEADARYTHRTTSTGLLPPSTPFEPPELGWEFLVEEMATAFELAQTFEPTDATTPFVAPGRL